MEQPSSPGTDPVELRNSMEELLKFTLQSHLNSTLELDIGLSKPFCTSLLNHTSPISPNAKASQIHLYKQLARALYEIITFGSSECDKVASFFQGSDLKHKEEWVDLAHKEGSQLTEILKNINFELHVQEPFFTQLKDGIKTIEGRCAVGDYNRIASGAFILFNKCLVLEVQAVHHYASFFEMLEAETLAKVLPGVKTIHEGVQVYRKFYTEEKEMANGVVAIGVTKVAAQPYLSLARLLSGLKYDGILSLINQEHLDGSMS
ncbi:uncharacterized protein LOC120138685 isoform X2 [Hibiscus syriacus]|uniref:uncharacterized protein LOC120138685 isoform X2 n=1 Tax=Hibiscus syriacus TaxID=106335 RepID=UPI0019244B47|nr:uncharacterized protein LOC120138685 isoform X2 [Hibiscus syriacus]